MDPDHGFILNNQPRHVVFRAVAAGEADLEKIAKKHHVVRPAAERAVTELVERKLLTNAKGALKLTPHGEQVAADLHKVPGVGP